jgi:hypothetical protein
VVLRVVVCSLPRGTRDTVLGDGKRNQIAGTSVATIAIVFGLRRITVSDRHFFVSELCNAGPLGCMYDSDSSDSTEGIEVEERIFVQVSCFNDGHIFELDVQRVGVREIANLHGAKPRSKNAL